MLLRDSRPSRMPELSDFSEQRSGDILYEGSQSESRRGAPEDVLELRRLQRGSDRERMFDDGVRIARARVGRALVGGLASITRGCALLSRRRVLVGDSRQLLGGQAGDLSDAPPGVRRGVEQPEASNVCIRVQPMPVGASLRLDGAVSTLPDPKHVLR